MKLIKIIVLVVIFCFLLITGNSLISKSAKESECLKCHTSASNLIKITREIAKTRPAVKAESHGEG